MIDIVRDKPAKTDKPVHTDEPANAGGPGGRTRRSVGLVVYDGMTLFELGVAFEVFGVDRSALFGVPWYRLLVCGATSPAVTLEGGLVMEVPHGLDRIGHVDTVIVPPTGRPGEVPVEVEDALRRAHRRGARIVSLCTGALVLAGAGLLDGRRATTHWTECGDLARRYPRVSVDPGVLYVDDGDILTSAGSAAGIDLCLHVVRQDFGSEIATQLARQLVVPPQRDGGQAQYIDTPMPTLDSSNLFADTVAWLQEHLEEPVTVDDLAARSAMSPRTFARRFLASTGTTPYQWLVGQRVQLAQRLLETTDLAVDLVAQHSGLGTAANLRKHFGRLVHTTPQAYRRTFRERRAG
jgi:transcriptional regulator GlxA family with amidase domain